MFWATNWKIHVPTRSLRCKLNPFRLHVLELLLCLPLGPSASASFQDQRLTGNGFCSGIWRIHARMSTRLFGVLIRAVWQIHSFDWLSHLYCGYFEALVEAVVDAFARVYEHNVRQFASAHPMPEPYAVKA